MEIRNLLDVNDNLKSQKDCIDFLIKLRWKGTPQCVFCHSDKVNRITCKYGYHKCRKCMKMFSATKGTIFEKSPVPLHKWFKVLYVMTAHKKGISSIQLAKDIGVTQKTGWFMEQRIRLALKDKDPQKLFGVIQVDETYVGGKNKNRPSHRKVPNSQGRSLKGKSAVFGITQVGGKLFTQVVPDTKGSTVKQIIKDMIHEGSIVVTDQYRSYKRMPKEFDHVVLNHKKKEYARGAFNNNTIEGFWSQLKRGINGIYHNVSRKHLDCYCNEFTFRFNTKKMNDGDRFKYSLGQVNCRITYAELRKKPGSKTVRPLEPAEN